MLLDGVTNLSPTVGIEALQVCYRFRGKDYLVPHSGQNIARQGLEVKDYGRSAERSA